MVYWESLGEGKRVWTIFLATISSILLTLALLLLIASPGIAKTTQPGGDAQNSGTGSPQSGWYCQQSGNELWSVSAVDAGTAWAVYNDSILKTVDGGATWNTQTTPQGGIAAVSAVDENIAYAVGWYGVIIKTTDGGATWVPQTSGTYMSLRGVSAVDANTAWAVGEYSGKGVILKTTDGGLNWVDQTPTLGEIYLSVSAVDGNVAWVGGFLRVLATSDGGVNWTTSYFPGGHAIGWFGISAVDYYNVWAVCDGGIYRYSYGGWAKQECGGLGEFKAVSAWNQDSAWAVNSDQAVKTADGGETWIQCTEGISGTLADIDAASAGSAWAVGDGGIFHTLPMATSISPASGSQNSTVSITDLEGLGFQEGATVQLRLGETVINATDVVVESAMKIRCTLSFGAQLTGSYDVVVKNPDGQEGIKEEAFSLQSNPKPCGTGVGMFLGLIGAMLGLLSLARVERSRNRFKWISACRSRRS